MRRWLPLALLAGLLLWFGLRPPPSPDDDLVSREFPAMGTWVSLSVHLTDPDRRADAERRLAAIEARMHAFDRRWSPDGNGELAAINRGQLDGFPDSMTGLRDIALRWHRRSHGLFDPRLGELITLWGFNRAEQFRSEPPAADAIDPLVAGLQIPPERRDTGSWNFGAIAKGWIVDRAMDSLAADGYADAIINAGGNLRVAGRRGERAWRIAIRHPRPSAERRWLAVVDADNGAIITSGDYERQFEHRGTRYHHLLDPRTGRPARSLQSLTVFAPTATDADALSTALFVAGAEDWRKLARDTGAEAVIAVHADGSVHATEAARRLARFPDHSPPVGP